ncbi:SpdD protein [Streptomyces sp. NBC_00859]|uniref:SpdD protein n=1 Tax=Streptomyces sp. NBC_00859 TaxID=2903682 RepID=UPI00386C15C3|nr:SpdD protein [Streptomyces sp. NBC_00859]
MFTPKYPTPDTAPALRPTTHNSLAPVCDHHHSPAPLPAAAPAPATRSGVQLTPGTLAVAIAGGAGVVLVVGAVLVSMLLAVALTGVSVAICAVVLRSLLNNHR